MSFSENFINIMDAIGKKIGIVIDWTNENIFPYIHELLTKVVNYELYTSLAWIGLLVITIICAIVLLFIGVKGLTNPDRHWLDDSLVGFIVTGIIIVIICIPLLICEVGDIITCLTLPEKTIIEFITKYK